jgi:hypothetical protein
MKPIWSLPHIKGVTVIAIDEVGGAFWVHCGKAHLKVIASDGGGWDHVSVSLPGRCPTWDEMEFIKRTFFRDDETAMQLHVPASEHIDIHPYCLHIWRPHDMPIPLPPSVFV